MQYTKISSVFWIMPIVHLFGFEITENQPERIAATTATAYPGGQLKVFKLSDIANNNGDSIILPSSVQQLLRAQLLLWAPLIVLNFNDSKRSSFGTSSFWLDNDDRPSDIDNRATTDIIEPSTVTANRENVANFSEPKGTEISYVASGNSQDENNESENLDYAESYQSIPAFKRNNTEPKLRISYHSYKRKGENTKCVRYNERYLYRKLEQAGMLNHWFMANTPEDAGRNFAQSYRNSFDDGSHYSDATSLPLADAFPDDEDTEASTECDDLCETIIRKLNEAVAKEQNHTQLLGSPFNDNDQQPVFDTESKKTTENTCQLGSFISAGECIPQGAEEIEGYSRLCASCHGVYMLNKMCFPRFINAVKCHSHTKGCVFDRISLQAHGSCYMRTFTLKVLHNKGTAECQQWYYEYINVPSSCECYLDSKSLFLSATKL